MVVCCSRNVCYMSLKGHIAIECHSQISGMRVGCHVGVTDSYTFGKEVLVCRFRTDDEDLCFVVVQLQHVGLHPLTDIGDTAFHFPDGNLG